MDVEVEDFLSHYGVRGQKWGVRKARAQGPGRRVGTMTTTTYSTKAQVGQVATGFATGLAANFLLRYASRPVRILGTVAGAAAGRAAVGHFMKKRGQKHVYEIRQAR
jgi:hypothetical protein